MTSYIKTKKQIKNDTQFYLNELPITNVDNWKLVTEKDNQFADKNKVIFGEPSCVYFDTTNHKTLVIVEVLKSYTFGSSTLHEENYARVLSQIVADTYFKNIGVYPKENSAYLVYADHSIIKPKIYSNSDVLLQLFATKACNLLNQQIISAEYIASLMTQNPFILADEASNFKSKQEWDDFF